MSLKYYDSIVKKEAEKVSPHTLFLLLLFIPTKNMNWKEEKRNGIKSHPKGKEIIVVSSGAVGIGKNVLGISEKPAGSVKQAYIIEENQKDIMLARKNKMTEPLIDRLLLNENRIRKIAEEAFPVICDRLSAKGVEIRGDEAARQIDERIAWA